MLTEAYVGGTSLNCLNAIHWYAKKCIGMVTWTVICPLCFSEYGHVLLARHFLKSILNNMVEAIMMTMPVIICNLYGCTRTVLFSIYASRVDRPKMMVLVCRAVELSFSYNGLVPQSTG